MVPGGLLHGPTELAFILRQLRAKMLIVADRWRITDFLARVQALPDLLRVVVIGDAGPAGKVKKFELQQAFAGGLTRPQ